MQIRNRLSGWLTLAVFATVGGAMVAADPAFAKVDVDKLTVSGEARVRYEYRVGATFGASKANESAASHRIRLGVGYDLTPDVSFFAQLQDARVYGAEQGAGGQVFSGIGAVSSANQNGTGVDLHQGYILVKNVLTPGLSLKLGRQEIIFGDHRLFGNFGWSQIGNSFDAVRVTHSTASADLDLFWARIADNEGVATFAGSSAAASSGAPIFPAGGTNGTLDQDVWGAYLTIKAIKNWTIEPYYFLLVDRRSSANAVAGATPTITTSVSIPAFGGAGCPGVGGCTATSTSSAVGSTAAVGLQTPQAPDQTRSTIGGRINGKQGGLDLTYEGALQFGAIASATNRATGNQVRDMHINAHAHAFKTGYTFDAVPMKPRLGFEFDYASGDNCFSTIGGRTADCNKHFNTFDNLFPTNHFHYGYMDLMAWRNMVNYQIMFDVKPSPVSKFQFNFIWHRLARTTDAWYRAGQVAYATPASTNQAASLGQELDIHYWHTFKEKFKFEVGYGHFFSGEFIEKSNPTNAAGQGFAAGSQGAAAFAGDGDQNWGYVMTSVLF